MEHILLLNILKPFMLLMSTAVTGQDQVMIRNQMPLKLIWKLLLRLPRQLRLRDMGGIIVVDFIDMQSAENKQLLYDKMKDVMANDRTKHNILPLTKFGLMQITRQRVRPEMNIVTDEKCPVMPGNR